MDDIVEDDDDATVYPTAKAGELDPSWLDPRSVARGRLSGRFCSVTSADSIATLYPRFVSFALGLGLNDFDAAALKDGRARPLTQAVATHLHSVTDLDGINFPSRHGDDLELWAIFERPDDPDVTPRVRDADHDELSQDHPDVIHALEILGLVWRSPVPDDGVSHLPPPDMPLPIVEVSGDEVMRRHTVNGNPDPTTPLGAAFLWWQGLADPVTYRHALEVMSHNPEVWCDYTEAADLIGDLAIMTGVESNADRSDVAYVKFIDYEGAEAGQDFADAPITDFWVVTLVNREDDDWWRVWGLSHGHFPSTAEVTGDE